jgi:hypothetical protein
LWTSVRRISILLETVSASREGRKVQGDLRGGASHCKPLDKIRASILGIRPIADALRKQISIVNDKSSGWGLEGGELLGPRALVGSVGKADRPHAESCTRIRECKASKVTQIVNLISARPATDRIRDPSQMLGYKRSLAESGIRLEAGKKSKSRVLPFPNIFSPDK